MTQPQTEGSPTPPARPSGEAGSKVLLWLTAAFGILGLLYLGVLEARRSKLVPDGAASPMFEMERYGGGTVSLEELRGKVVMLDFWATWCPPCKKEMPTLVKLAKEYEGRGLVFVAASRDDDDVKEELVGQFIQRFLPELAPYVVYASDEMARAYRVEALPTLYLLNREGKVTDAVRGMMSESSLRKRIEKALEP